MVSQHMALTLFHLQTPQKQISMVEEHTQKHALPSILIERCSKHGVLQKISRTPPLTDAKVVFPFCVHCFIEPNLCLGPSVPMVLC